MTYPFSIFIPSLNNLRFLQTCVDSIRKNSAIKHQIIVHVNDGSDGTLQWVRNQPDIDYTYSLRNVGVCVAMNMMRTKAIHDYIYFINDDMYVLPGWDTVLFEELDRLGENNHDSKEGRTHLFYLSSSTIQPHHWPHKGTGLLQDFGDTVENFQEEALKEYALTAKIADWQGATRPPCLVHRDTWDIVGGYSIELTPGYGSDPDFTAKLYLIGTRHFKGLGRSWAYHFESKTTTAVRANNYLTQFRLKWGMSNGVMRNYLTFLGHLWSDRQADLETSNYRLFRKRFAIWWAMRRATWKAFWKSENLLEGRSPII